MRTSLFKIHQIEKFISGELAPGDELIMEARMITDCELKESVHLQKRLLHLLKIRHYRHLKKELGDLHNRIITRPENQAFEGQIKQYFIK